jgi:hypothetical protein
MKVNEYVQNLVQLLKKDPEIGELEVIYSQDDEGNSYQKVNFHACLLKTKGLKNQYIDVEIQIDEYEIDKNTTALCIN